MPESYLQQLQRARKARLKRIAEASIEKPPPPFNTVFTNQDEDKQTPAAAQEVVHRKEVNFREIFKEVCAYYNISMLDAISSRRTMKIALARHVIAYIASQHTALSLSQIASRLDKDRTTIAHSIARVKELMHTDRVPGDIQAIKARLGI